MNRFPLSMAILVAGCAARFPAHRPLADGSLRGALLEVVRPPLAAPRAIKQRVIFDLDGEEATLTVYASVFPSGSIYLSGLSDFGSTAFAARRTASGSDTRGRWPTFSEALLVDFLEDQALAFLPPARDAVGLVQLADGSAALLWRQADREVLLRQHDERGFHRLEAGRRGRLRAVIRIEAWKRDEAGRRYPARFTVEGKDCRAWVEVLSYQPLAVTEEEIDTAFESAAEGGS